MSETDKAGGWTVKNVPPDKRTLMNSAARRADMTLGEWLVDTAEKRIAAERTSRIEPQAVIEHNGASHEASPGPPRMPIGEIAALMTAMEGLAGVKGFGGMLAQTRKVVVAGLADYLPPAAPTRKALAGTSPTPPASLLEQDAEPD
ncbi:MAG: hypothetical protein NVS2B11_07020 [Acetobacteraceae bacterium]